MSAPTLPTIAASEIPASLLNAQGTILDPVAIKKSSAAKMRLADKTGNVALRKEAAAEQSFADRLGGRTALLSDELKKQIQEQKEAAAKAAEAAQEANPTGEQALVSPPAEMKKTRKNKHKETDADAQHKPLDSAAQPFQPTKLVQSAALAALNTNYALPPEAIILKLDAASKQSIADKTGNLILKRTAALEQSLADKMAHVSAPGVTTTALRAGRKGFMLDACLFQTTQPTPAPTTAPKQASPTQRQQRPSQQQHQRRERSYFNKDNQTVSPTRADSNTNWRQPSPKQSPTPQRTSPIPQRASPKESPILRQHEEMDGADVVTTTSPKLDIEEKMKQMEVCGPVINPLAPAPACM